MATLLVADQTGDPQRYPIADVGTTKIGRKSDNHVVLEDSHVSSYHAEIRFDRDANRFVIRDLGSHNGTRLNGEAVGEKEVAIKQGDTLVFGILEATLLTNKPVRSLAPKPLAKPDEKEAESDETESNGVKKIDFETRAESFLATLKVDAIPPKDAGTEQVPVEEVCQELIKRLDLIDDLLERYTSVKKDEEVVKDMEALKRAFQDMLGQYQVEAYSFDPETEINVEMRKKIEIVDTVKSTKKNGANRIVQTLHEGYVRQREGSQPVILRKAHVTTRVSLSR